MTEEEFVSIRESITPNECGCRIWERGMDKDGYPILYVGGRNVRGNRYALQLQLGRQIASGYLACHTCDTPSCVEVSHLYEGTAYDNSRDKRVRNRLGVHWTTRMPERVARGERKTSIMTEKLVREMRDMYDTHPEMTYQEIADRYGVSRRNTIKVVKRETWRHVG